MKTFVKETNTVNVLAEYLDAGFSKKSYPAWVRRHFAGTFVEGPPIDTTKNSFYVSARKMIDVVQNSQKFKVNLEKREKWLSEAYKDINSQYQLNFESILNNPILKKSFSIITSMRVLMKNDCGMGYSARKEMAKELRNSEKIFLESILAEFGIKPSKPEFISIDGALRYLGLNGMPLTENEFFKKLEEHGLCDATHEGSNILRNKVVADRFWDNILMVDVYLLLIFKLWK